MKAIEVKFLGATNTQGARLKAFAEGVRGVVIPFPYDKSGEQAFKDAALVLCSKYEWGGDLVGGVLRNGNHVFCFKQ